MKITNYDKNHGKFVHEDWLQKIINLVPNLVQLTDAKSIEAIHFENDVTLVDYINQDGELVEGEPVASYLNANVTGDGSMGHIKTISFLNVYGEPTVLAGIKLQDYDPNVPYKTFNFDDSIRYAFDNSSDKFIATDKQLGIVKYSKTNPTRVDADGTINTHYDGTGIGLNDNHDLSLLPATDTTLGGVMPDGDTIIANDGVLTALTPYNIGTTRTVGHSLDETLTLDTTNYIDYLSIAMNRSEAFFKQITGVAIDLTTTNAEIASDTPIIGFQSLLTPKTNSLIPIVSADKKVYHLYYAYDAAGSKIKTVEPLPANTRFTYVGTV